MNIKTAFTTKLKESCLTPKLVAPYGIEPVDSAQQIDDSLYDLPAIRIPYHDGFERVRYLGPLPEGVPKYQQPPSTGTHVFTTPEHDSQDLFITEGEFKAIAGRTHLIGQWLGLGGVDMVLADGKIHPDIAAAAESKNVFVVFDVEPIDKQAFWNVHRSAMRLLALLKQVPGCNPHYFDMATLPGMAALVNDGKAGVDDWIAGCGLKPAEAKMVFDRTLERFAQPVDMITDDFLELHRDLAFDRSQGKIFHMPTGQHLSKEAADLQYAPVQRTHVNPNTGSVSIKQVLGDWRTSRTRIEIERVVYEPTQDPGLVGRSFNRWTEPPCSTQKASSPRHFIKLVKHVAPQSWEYVLNWLAAVVQWREKIGTCVVLAGNPGTGKSAVVEAMRHILLDPALALDWTERTGQRYHPSFTRLDNQRLRSAFTSGINDALFVAFEEALFRHDDKALDMVERVKHLITENTGISEEKYLKATVTRQHFNLLMTTNHVGLLKLFNMDNDRRFCVDWSDEPMSLDWYSTYFEWLASGGAASIYHMLMGLDISDFDPRVLPKTDIREQIADGGISEFEGWFNESFGRDGELLSTVTWGNPAFTGTRDLWRIRDIQYMYEQFTGKHVTSAQVSALFAKRSWIYGFGKTMHPRHPAENVVRSAMFGFKVTPRKFAGKRSGWIGKRWAQQHLANWEDLE